MDIIDKLSTFVEDCMIKRSMGCITPAEERQLEWLWNTICEIDPNFEKGFEEWRKRRLEGSE